MDGLSKKIEETEIKIEEKERVINVINFVLSDGGFGALCAGFSIETIDYFRQVKNKDGRELEKLRDNLQTRRICY
jgi:hypothetical protein